MLDNPTLSEDQRSTLMTLAQDIEKLNSSMREAVDAGLSIELERASRHHHSAGYWGDILAPRVVKKA